MGQLTTFTVGRLPDTYFRAICTNVSIADSSELLYLELAHSSSLICVYKDKYKDKKVNILSKILTI